ncbi:glycoside hydrolase family 16 protein [Calocera cornea HHB12733]|uniref:Glycoside hydrolase family 16 protein n=1 Tax=Calocera cornea HHB12733 TaxID=1353952 RepID=A0A165I940_9BASI|nr:glycoside hydrolase family 16 protein [Calocera cornea HHB12733]
MLATFTSLLALSSLAPVLGKTTYTIKDTYIGPSFLNGFDHWPYTDPTHGRVNYVDQDTAISLNLTFAEGKTFVMRADDTTVLDPNGPGRNSVRIQSKNAYSEAVMVMDLRHMPDGCATWPAWWTTASNWPTGGEIDIIEYVNGESPNHMTLHTSPNCTQPQSRRQTGTTTSTDCDANVDWNTGCGVMSSASASAGSGFNSIGGGWYAMERAASSISVWFWPRNSATVPAAVKAGARTVSTKTFGTPDSTFVSSQCDFGTHFEPHNIIFDLTLCGDWAGNNYPSSCPSTCVDYVNNNPQAFSEAYWDIAGLRIYE